MSEVVYRVKTLKSSVRADGCDMNETLISGDISLRAFFQRKIADFKALRIPIIS